jgi:hypothetical protein
MIAAAIDFARFSVPTTLALTKRLLKLLHCTSLLLLHLQISGILFFVIVEVQQRLPFILGGY